MQLANGAEDTDLFNSFYNKVRSVNSWKVRAIQYFGTKNIADLPDDWSVQQELDKFDLDGISHRKDDAFNDQFNVALLISNERIIHFVYGAYGSDRLR